MLAGQTRTQDTDPFSTQAPSSDSSVITSASLEVIYTAITSIVAAARVERLVGSIPNLVFCCVPMR